MLFLKDERSKRALRGIRTMFFLVTMSISFLFFSVPVLVAVTDVLVPSALLVASVDDRSLSLLQTISSLLINYDFRYSLIDIPMISIIRSGIILCVYGLCDGPDLSTGPSLLFVSLKAAHVFGGGGGGDVGARELGLFVCSATLVIGHMVAAYQASCRE